MSANIRFVAAMTTYAALALLAAFTLDGGLIRNAVWILMAGLAAKTYIAYRAGGGERGWRDDNGKPSKRLDPIHPGEILLEDFLKPLAISINQLARDS